MNRLTLIFCAATLLSLASCRDNDDNQNDDSGAGYSIPETYSFIDANGTSTVNFNGQAQRLEMLTEISALLASANAPGTAIDAQYLKDMYANAGVTWDDVSALGMTGSSKQLKNKTAASSGTPDPTIQAEFESLMDAIASLSATTVDNTADGGPGIAGVVLSSSNPNKQYLQDAQGQEYHQLIEKGLMGAVLYNQISMVYLGEEKMSADNECPVDAATGKHYTALEHHWDEAFGYFTTSVHYPSTGADRFWGKYAAQREALLGSASAIAAAFRTGRAAISNDDLATRDVQISIIRSELERVCGATAIHYLNSANSNFIDHALRNHALSEAVAFLTNLKYGFDASVSVSEINVMLETIGSDYYAVSSPDLVQVRDQLAQRLNLEDVKDAL